MKKRRYSDEQIIEAVRASTSIRQVLAMLGLAEAGGNYSIIKRHIQRLTLDTKHFHGQGWRKGSKQSVTSARPLSEILKQGSQYQSYKLKLRLLRENVKEARCQSCGLTRWMSRPIALELDHVNGDNTDNRLENLRLLCPNCHALTDTYRGKKLAKCRDETAPF